MGSVSEPDRDAAGRAAEAVGAPDVADDVPAPPAPAPGADAAAERRAAARSPPGRLPAEPTSIGAGSSASSRRTMFQTAATVVGAATAIQRTVRSRRRARS